MAQGKNGLEGKNKNAAAALTMNKLNACTTNTFEARTH